MKKLVTVVFAVITLNGCTSNPDANEYGQRHVTDDPSYVACSEYRSQKHEYQPVLDKVVASGLLTPNEANRAMDRDVRVGDPKCLAYAAYGADVKGWDYGDNGAGKFAIKSVVYTCDWSDVPCPGIEIIFAGEKVYSVAPLTDAKAKFHLPSQQ